MGKMGLFPGNLSLWKQVILSPPNTNAKKRQNQSEK